MTLEEALKQTVTKQKRGNPETREQIELFKWLRANSGKYPVLLKPYAIPNGEKRDKVTAGILKAAGVQAGVWDIFVPNDQTKVPTPFSMYIEMKAPGRASQGDKALSQEQRDFRTRNGDGFYYSVCFTWIEAAKDICWFYGLLELRDTLK